MDNPGIPIREWLDRDLVVAFKEGDADAYDEMYRRYGGRVSGVCFRMLGNSDDAHEATQETFLKAYQALPRFNGNYKLGAWLARIAANVCLDQLRARSRRATMVPLAHTAETLDDQPGPEEIVAYRDRAFDTLERIQPLHARALALRALDGMSHQEMADRLAMSPSQVKALLHRARDSFKRAWENASGWVIAPFIGFRSIVSDSQRSASVAGGPLTTMSSVASPLLAEKVAASAIVFATALAGVGGASGPSVSSTTTPGVDSIALSPDALERSIARSQVALPSSARASKAGIVDQVLAEIEQAVEDKKEEAPKENDDRKDDNENEFVPRDADRAGTQLARKVQKTIDDINPLP